MTSIEKKVKELIEPIINKLDYELYDVIYTKEGKDYYLKIFIDNDCGISLEDCEKVNNAITDILDEKDYIKQQYFLEISSAGLERVLREDKHFKDNIGKLVELRLYKNLIDNKKIINGILKDFDDDSITIEVEKKDIRVERKEISNIKTIYEW